MQAPARHTVTSTLSTHVQIQPILMYAHHDGHFQDGTWDMPRTLRELVAFVVAHNGTDDRYAVCMPWCTRIDYFQYLFKARRGVRGVVWTVYFVYAKMGGHVFTCMHMPCYVIRGAMRMLKCVTWLSR